MRSFILLCVFVTIAFVQADNERIIGGQAAKVGQIPWQVLVRYRVPGGMSYCGGTLISNRWVITAAHCTRGASNFSVKLGAIERRGNEVGSVEIPASNVIVHPEYDGYLKNDIALIRTSKPIKFTNRIKPAKLPKKGQVVAANTRVFLSGWGQTQDVGPSSDYLNYVALTTISNEKCSTLITNIIESQLCAVGNPPQSACYGDSGGPVVILKGNEATHVGIVSFANGNGCSKGPSGFVRIEFFLDFIHKNTGVY